MNLIAYPHYTCGGLLCDILNNTFSPIGAHGGIANPSHNRAKIGDSLTVFDTYDPKHFEEWVEQFHGITGWVGTHCWPGLNDVSKFDNVILVTTTTYRSKIYRWARAYYHYYTPSRQWAELSGMFRIDKERETAKNYVQPFSPINGSNIVNIEFSEVVEETGNFTALVQDYNSQLHLDRWKNVNNFLYDDKFWTSTPVQRYYEAELEVNLNSFYRYDA